MEERREEDRRLANLEVEVASLKSDVRWIKSSLEAIVPLPTAVAKISLATDACEEDTKYLRSKIEARDEERKKEREVQRLERKSDRRWMVGTALTTTAIILTVVGILFG